MFTVWICTICSVKRKEIQHSFTVNTSYVMRIYCIYVLTPISQNINTTCLILIRLPFCHHNSFDLYRYGLFKVSKSIWTPLEVDADPFSSVFFGEVGGANCEDLPDYLGDVGCSNPVQFNQILRCLHSYPPIFSPAMSVVLMLWLIDLYIYVISLYEEPWCGKNYQYILSTFNSFFFFFFKHNVVSMYITPNCSNELFLLTILEFCIL